MPSSLRELTREFARGEAPLETLRGAARAERTDRHLADRILALISEWERGGRTDSHWSRNELRDRAKKLVPDIPVKTVASRRDPTEIMYNAGIKGRRPK